MIESLGHSQRVHLLAYPIARFQSCLQVMARNFDGERVGNDFTRPVLVLDPGREGQRNPYWPAIYEKLDIDGIGMSRGDGYHQRLKNAVHFPLGPTVERMKVLVHADSISEHSGASKPQGRGGAGSHLAGQPQWITMAG